MGFFNKLLGRKKNKDEEDSEAGSEPESRPEPEPEPEPVKKTRARAKKPKPEPEVKAEAASESEPEPESPSEPEPEHAAPTDTMPDDNASSSSGVITEASGTMSTGSGGASIRAMSSGSLRAAPNMIQCNSCDRDLPMPLAAGITVTCPYCLGRTPYKP